MKRKRCEKDKRGGGSRSSDVKCGEEKKKDEVTMGKKPRKMRK